ncbi:Hsp20/alpha crystallin family protein [Candidatus Micrarchaeota archaeon]|nr:Hsp20/alpha crystallin family protein [Candidatus Micrarchaeota archaeon]
MMDLMHFDGFEPAYPDFFERPKPLPRATLREEPDAFIVAADVNGMRKEDLKVIVYPDSVSIRGLTHRKESRDFEDSTFSAAYLEEFKRVIPFPEEVNPDLAISVFKDGKLELRVPKLSVSEKGGKLLRID